MKNCLIINCTKKYYAKGYCRNHYRSLVNKEGQKAWRRVKNNPVLYQKRLLAISQYFQRLKKTDKYIVYKEKHNAQQKKYYYQDNRRREYLSRWKKNLSEDKRKEYRRKDEYTRNFGNWKIREATIIRDGEKCTNCKITREEHLKKWNQDLHVDHIDNYGHNLIKSYKNNKPENLKTYCIKCHRSKSAKERTDIKRLELLLYGLEFTVKLKEKIRIKYNRKCFDCLKSEKQLKRKLDIHHLDGNKRNNIENNLIPLCVKCHSLRESSKRKSSTS